MADAGARRRRLVLTDAVRDGHLAIFVKREVQAGVLALQNGENPPALVFIAIATFLLVTTAAFFVFGLALAATWVLIGGAMLAVTLGGRDGLELFGSLMYMLAVFLWGNVACGVLERRRRSLTPASRRSSSSTRAFAPWAPASHISSSTSAPRRAGRRAARRTTRSWSSTTTRASASTTRSRSDR